MIYFDNAATSLYKPVQVEKAVIEAFHTIGNSGRGAHAPTLAASRTIYNCREELAALFHIKFPERIAFTSNVTESLNLAVSGLFHAGDHVVTTACEHNSVLRPLYRKENEGMELTIIPTLKQTPEEQRKGLLDYDAMEQACKSNTKAIVITHASNLTGNITDLKRVSEIAKKHGLILIVDAAQTAGALQIDVEEMGIDILCFTGHKGLLGPQGTGGIYIREGMELPSFKVGGSGVHSYDKTHPAQMPTALEAGTLNGHGIAGLCAAVNYLLEQNVENIRQKELKLLKLFVDGVSTIPGVTLYGNPDLSKRMAIASLRIRDYDSASVSDWLWEDYEIAVRAGAHCAPLMHESLGTKEQGLVRFSFSHFNTEKEIETAIQAVKELAEE
jgi:cysteine desulfurase family protein